MDVDYGHLRAREVPKTVMETMASPDSQFRQNRS